MRTHSTSANANAGASARTPKRARESADLSPLQLAAEIRRYCDSHPHARDSLDGIAWWLAWERFKRTKTSLQSAVETLVADGVLESHRLTDGSVVFGCVSGCGDGASAPGTRASTKRSSRRSKSGKATRKSSAKRR